MVDDSSRKNWNYFMEKKSDVTSKVEVEKLIGRVPVETRPPHEAAEQSGVQVGQVQVCSDSGRGEPATKIFFGNSLAEGVD